MLSAIFNPFYRKVSRCRYHSVIIQKLTFQNNNQLYKNTSKANINLIFTYLIKIQIDLHQLTHTKTLKIKALHKN